MNDLALSIRAFSEGEVIACIWIADALADQDHPLTARAVELAEKIVSVEDWNHLIENVAAFFTLIHELENDHVV